MRTNVSPRTLFDPPEPFPAAPFASDFDFGSAPVAVGRTEPGLPDGEIAALPTERILAMTRGELVAVIRGVRGDHLRPGAVERLDQTDDDTLRRLVYLTRRLCRDRQRLAGAAVCGSPR